MVVYNWDNTPDKFIKRHKWEYGYVVFQQMQWESRGESAQYVLVTKNGDEYDVTGGPHWLPNNNTGYPGLKYLCVYDINNPKSFAIYYDCPILDSIPKFRAIGSIRKIKKTDQIFRIDFEIDSVLILDFFRKTIEYELCIIRISIEYPCSHHRRNMLTMTMQ